MRPTQTRRVLIGETTNSPGERLRRLRDHARVEVRSLLEPLESAEDDDILPTLAFVAAQEVNIDRDELRAAQRRALLLLAAGGDPTRELDPAGRAVRSLAGDLDTPRRREELDLALGRLRGTAEGLPRVAAALDSLLADGELAWRSLAAALVAGELTRGDDD
jgi:hypothetical protein